ncbi:MAG: cyclin-dependent kinase inhibitor 3 family protein [Myxococcales bacterium]|jgi:protein-tyrosine phosphatase
MLNARTSDTDPIKVALLPQELVGLPGRIGLTFAPGKKHKALTGEWYRDVDKDLERLCQAYGTRVLVSLIEDPELDLLGIPELFDRCAFHGIQVIRFPIPDGGVPRELGEFSQLVERILADARAGKTVVIQCRGGLGRSGLVASSCLVSLGVAPNDAIAAVRRVRPGAVENQAQERFIHDFLGAR